MLHRTASPDTQRKGSARPGVGEKRPPMGRVGRCPGCKQPGRGQRVVTGDSREASTALAYGNDGTYDLTQFRLGNHLGVFPNPRC